MSLSVSEKEYYQTSEASRKYNIENESEKSVEFIPEIPSNKYRYQALGTREHIFFSIRRPRTRTPHKSNIVISYLFRMNGITPHLSKGKEGESVRKIRIVLIHIYVYV